MTQLWKASRKFDWWPDRRTAQSLWWHLGHFYFPQFILKWRYIELWIWISMGKKREGKNEEERDCLCEDLCKIKRGWWLTARKEEETMFQRPYTHCKKAERWIWRHEQGSWSPSTSACVLASVFCFDTVIRTLLCMRTTVIARCKKLIFYTFTILCSGFSKIS